MLTLGFQNHLQFKPDGRSFLRHILHTMRIRFVHAFDHHIKPASDFELTFSSLSLEFLYMVGGQKLGQIRWFRQMRFQEFCGTTYRDGGTFNHHASEEFLAMCASLHAAGS